MTAGPKAKQSPRSKELDRIMTKIATFAVSKLYTDEPDAQRELSEAIQHIEKAQAALIEPDN